MSASGPKETKTTSTSTTLNEVLTNNLNVSGNQGLTVAGNEGTDLLYDASTTANLDDHSTNVNATSDSRSYSSSYSSNYSSVISDEGAIKAGQSIALDSIDLTGNLANHAFDLANATSSRDMTLASNFAQGSADFAGALTKQVIQFVGAEAQNQAATLANTVSALNNIQTQNSTSSDQRIADIASNANNSQAQVVKYALVAVAVVGGIYLLSKSKAA